MATEDVPTSTELKLKLAEGAVTESDWLDPLKINLLIGPGVEVVVACVPNTVLPLKTKEFPVALVAPPIRAKRAPVVPALLPIVAVPPTTTEAPEAVWSCTEEEEAEELCTELNVKSPFTVSVWLAATTRLTVLAVVIVLR